MLSQRLQRTGFHVTKEPSRCYNNRENFWTATAIQQELSRHLKAADVPNLTNLGLALKKLRWQRVKNKNDRGYYLRLRKGGTVPA